MVYRLQYLTLVYLLLSLTFPLDAWGIESFRTLPVLAQSLKAGKAEADKLMKQGDQLSESHQPQSALQAFQQALSIYRQIKDKKGVGLALNYIGNVYSDYLDEYNKAITYYQQALEIAQSINDTGLEAKALNNLGLVQLHLGNSQRAIEYCEKALVVARQNKNYETEAIALKSLGGIYILTDTTKGLDFAEQALVVLQKASGSPEDKLRQRKLETNILIALGNLYYAIGAAKLVDKDATGEQLLNKSLQNYQQAIKIAKKIGDRTREGKALLGIGDIYHIKSRYPKAIETFQQALQIFQKDKNFHLEARSAYTRLGDVYIRWGKREQGLTSYQQALEIIKTEIPYSLSNKLEQDTKQGLLLINIGNIYADTSKYEKALDSYKQALEILKLALNQANTITSPGKQFQEKQINQGIQFAHLRMCLVYKFLGQTEEGRKACQAAKDTSANSAETKSLSSKNKSFKSPADLEKAKKKLQMALESLKRSQVLGNPDFIAVDLAQVGDAYTQLGEYKQAMEYFRKAIELSKEIQSPQLKPYIFLAFGEFYEKQKQYDQAISYYKQAGEFAKQSGDKLQEATTFKQIGITGFIANKLPEATTALYRAVDIFDAIRVDLIDDRQISIFETQASTYSLLQKTLINQNKFKEALEVSERSRARAFINLLAARVSSKSDSKSNAAIPNISPPKLQDIQKIAREQNATIIEYSVPKPPRYKDENNDNNLLWDSSEFYIWVVKPTGEITFKLVDLKLFNVSSLAELVKNSRISLGAGGRGINVEPTGEPMQKQNLQTLYRVLVEPIASLLPTNPDERVIFVPHESLFLVPFVALQDKDGKYLIEKHAILTAPAIQVLELTHKQRQRLTSKDVLVMGNPIMPKVGKPPVQLQSLPGAETEAVTIASLFKTKAITGKDATKAAFTSQLSSARIIHLATHGLLDNPSKSIKTAIALAPFGNDDGLLTPAEIVNLKVNAELVVLSACDTGRGTITGDGVIGLSRSLITAGASSVIVSLWSVPDSPTAELMKQFYENWQHNPDKAKALRAAMLTTMKKHPEPVNWAAFTLIGESK